MAAGAPSQAPLRSERVHYLRRGIFGRSWGSAVARLDGAGGAFALLAADSSKRPLLTVTTGPGCVARAADGDKSRPHQFQVIGMPGPDSARGILHPLAELEPVRSHAFTCANQSDCVHLCVRTNQIACICVR